MAGRPSKYGPELCDKLVSHMAQGLSFESFAGKIGVHRDTLYAWVSKHGAFSDAKKRGESASLLWWETLGRAALLGSDVKNDKGEVVISGKKVSVALWIYNMKCRFRGDWLEHSKNDSSLGDDLVPISIAYDPKKPLASQVKHGRQDTDRKPDRRKK